MIYLQILEVGSNSPSKKFGLKTLVVTTQGLFQVRVSVESIGGRMGARLCWFSVIAQFTSTVVSWYCIRVEIDTLK